MNKFFEKFEEKIMPIATFFSQEKHFLAMRDGLVTAVPLTIIGSIFLLIASPPISPTQQTGIGWLDSILMVWYNLVSPYSAQIKAPFRATMGLTALLICFAIAFSLAKSYNKKALNFAVCTTSIFLLVVAPVSDGVISATYLDSKGIIMAVFVALVSVEIMRFVDDKGWTIKMPKGVPPVVESSFAALTPFLISLCFIYGLSLFCQATTGMLLPELWTGIFAKFSTAIENVFVIGGLTAFENLLFTFGVHPTTVVGPLLDPLQLINITANADALAAGLAPSHIYNASFWSFYSALGGAGATLSLSILLVFSKDKSSKEIGKVALIPSIFNINEPLIFGLPIFLNPIFVIPFMIAPTVNIFLGWFATQTGLVNIAVISAPWTTPGPLGALISTLDFRAFILVVVMIFLDAIVYYPFLKMHENVQRKLTETETQTEEE